MRRSISLILFVLLAAFALGPSPALGGNEIIVTGHPQSPPIMWKTKGRMEGIGPEVVDIILTQLDVPHVIRPEGTWQEVQDKVAEGTVDMVVAMYDNPERRKVMLFSEPYMKQPVVIVVPKDRSFAFRQWSDLIGKRGVSNVGESYGEEFDAYIREKLDVKFVPYEQAFAMLKEDRADYLVIDFYPALVYSRMLRVADKVEILDNPVTIQASHITISKKSPAASLLPKINERILAMRSSGQIEKIAEAQYAAWKKNLRQREKFFQAGEQAARAEQEEYSKNADAFELNALGRYLNRDSRYFYY